MNTQKEQSPEKGKLPAHLWPEGHPRGAGEERIPVCQVSEFYKQGLK